MSSLHVFIHVSDVLIISNHFNPSSHHVQHFHHHVSLHWCGKILSRKQETIVFLIVFTMI